MKIHSIVIIAGFICLAACQPKNKTDELAKELCICLRPMIEVYERMGGQMEGADEDQIVAVLEELEALAAESEACANKITEKYGDLADREAELEPALRKACPDIMQRMDEFNSSMEDM